MPLNHLFCLVHMVNEGHCKSEAPNPGGTSGAAEEAGHIKPVFTGTC